MAYGVGPISQYATCGVEYRFQDQYYDVDEKVQKIKDILWNNRIDHRIYFDRTNGCSRISVRMMPKELFDEIEPIYKSCYIYNPKNEIRRKTKDEFIEDPHLGVPESCRAMIRLYGSNEDPYRNSFIEKVYGYLFKYFYHQHWIHPWCNEPETFENKDRAFMEALKALHDDEIIHIPWIGVKTEPLVKQMRDDAISGKLILDEKAYPYTRHKNIEDIRREKRIKKMINKAKVIEDWGEFEKETYSKYGIDPKTQKPVKKTSKKGKKK